MAQLGPILEGGTAVSLSSRLITIIPLAIIFIMMRTMMGTRNDEGDDEDGDEAADINESHSKLSSPRQNNCSKLP